MTLFKHSKWTMIKGNGEEDFKIEISKQATVTDCSIGGLVVSGSLKTRTCGQRPWQQVDWPTSLTFQLPLRRPMDHEPRCCSLALPTGGRAPPDIHFLSSELIDWCKEEHESIKCLIRALERWFTCPCSYYCNPNNHSSIAATTSSQQVEGKLPVPLSTALRIVYVYQSWAHPKVGGLVHIQMTTAFLVVKTGKPQTYMNIYC